jgi:hypothetical protein
MDAALMREVVGTIVGSAAAVLAYQTYLTLRK